jgi:hypothetical protein
MHHAGMNLDLPLGYHAWHAVMHRRLRTLLVRDRLLAAGPLLLKRRIGDGRCMTLSGVTQRYLLVSSPTNGRQIQRILGTCSAPWQGAGAVALSVPACFDLLRSPVGLLDMPMGSRYSAQNNG